MKLSRAIRKTVGRLLIGVLLFAQLAVAAYACPGLSGTASNTASESMPGVSAQSVTESSTSLVGWEQIDASAANLCAGHCQQGQQSGDTAPAPTVHAAVPMFLYSFPIEPAQLLDSGQSRAIADISLAAAPSPSHAILHCVFRT